MISDFFQSLWVTDHRVFATQFTHRQQSMELFPCLPVINPSENQRGSWPREKKGQQRNKNNNAGSEIQTKHKWS